MYRALRWLSAILCVGFLVTVRVSAQTVVNAQLAPPQVDAFPRISSFLRVHDTQGKFIHGIEAGDIRLSEDGQPVLLHEFQEQRPGVQLVIALNPGEPFAVRDSKGLSRYDILIESIADWAKRRLGSSLDDLSILVTNGPQKTHASNPMDLLYALEHYQVIEGSSQPTLDTLLKTVEVAADDPPRPGMEQVVLFVTAPLAGDQSFGLQNVIDRASQANVKIIIWLVAPLEEFESQTTRALIDLSQQTGGTFLHVSNEEQISDLEVYLEPLRDIYFFSYDSQARASGKHELEVEIQIADQVVSAASQSFDFNLQPPNLAFLSPSTIIFRELETGAGESPGNVVAAEVLMPQEYNLQVLVDFPDGRSRPLVHSALFVDGVVVDENVEPPFDQFTWDLSKISETGEHIIRAEAVDNLGLTGATVDTLVQIKVDRPPASLLASLSNRVPLIAGIVVGFSGLFLLFVLILGGKIRPRPSRLSNAFMRGRRGKPDPLTQPIQQKSEGESRRRVDWASRLQWPQRHMASHVYAYFSRINETDETPTPAPVPVTVNELTIGRDTKQAIFVINDPSVESLHARLVRQADGAYLLTDEGSVAGTWINYAPVSRQGVCLQHGDLVHIGRVGFRFTQREPIRVRRPIIIKEDPWV